MVHSRLEGVRWSFGALDEDWAISNGRGGNWFIAIPQHYGTSCGRTTTEFPFYCLLGREVLTSFRAILIEKCSNQKAPSSKQIRVVQNRFFSSLSINSTARKKLSSVLLSTQTKLGEYSQICSHHLKNWGCKKIVLQISTLSIAELNFSRTQTLEQIRLIQCTKQGCWFHTQHYFWLLRKYLTFFPGNAYLTIYSSPNMSSFNGSNLNSRHNEAAEQCMCVCVCVMSQSIRQLAMDPGCMACINYCFQMSWHVNECIV